MPLFATQKKQALHLGAAQGWRFRVEKSGSKGKIASKRMIVIGDRVLIRVDEQEKRTEVGLYLPDTVRDKEEVLAGTIVRTGPGMPMVDPLALTSDLEGDEADSRLRYIPMQAKAGDHALFLRKAAIEIQYEGEKYLLLPQSALLLVIRTGSDPDDLV